MATELRGTTRGLYVLRMLGGIGLVDDRGREVDAILRQPKHLALLSYLALPEPGAWHRRDMLLAVFWPELDQARARTALRSALHTLRRQLCDGAVRNRGDTEVSLDPELITTDVGAMLQDFNAGNHAGVLERYAGELLPALHIAEAEGFEKWLDSERSRIRDQARRAATLFSESCEAAGDWGRACEAARRAAELEPDDETATRRWIALLDRAGDRAQAFAVYDSFQTRLARDFDAAPSAETVALVEAIRARRAPASSRQDETPAALTDRAPRSKITHGLSGWLIAGLAGMLVVIAVVAATQRKRTALVGAPREPVVVSGEPIQATTHVPHPDAYKMSIDAAWLLGRRTKRELLSARELYTKAPNLRSFRLDPRTQAIVRSRGWPVAEFASLK